MLSGHSVVYVAGWPVGGKGCWVVVRWCMLLLPTSLPFPIPSLTLLDINKLKRFVQQLNMMMKDGAERVLFIAHKSTHKCIRKQGRMHGQFGARGFTLFSSGLATLKLAVSVSRSVGRSVRPSVRSSFRNQNKMRAFFCHSAPGHPSAT